MNDGNCIDLIFTIQMSTTACATPSDDSATAPSPSVLELSVVHCKSIKPTAAANRVHGVWGFLVTKSRRKGGSCEARPEYNPDVVDRAGRVASHHGTQQLTINDDAMTRSHPLSSGSVLNDRLESRQQTSFFELFMARLVTKKQPKRLTESAISDDRGFSRGTWSCSCSCGTSPRQLIAGYGAERNGIRLAGRRTLDDQIVIAPRMVPIMRYLKRVGYSSPISSAYYLRII